MNKKGLAPLGLAIDIDETLAATIDHWLGLVRERFQDLLDVSICDLSNNELIKRFGFAQNIPGWAGTPVVEQWIEEACYDKNIISETPPIEYANDTLQGLVASGLIEVKAYLTMRPTEVDHATADWLQQHNFPHAPLLSKPESIAIQDRYLWKAQTLSNMFPSIGGIIDDHPTVVRMLPKSYPGTYFLFGHEDRKVEELGRADIEVVPCPDWKAVEKALTVNLHRYQKKLELGDGLNLKSRTVENQRDILPGLEP